MNKSFETEIGRLSVQLNRLLDRTKSFNQDQLNFKPSESEWSILQVVQHLINAETHTNMYLRKKIKAGKHLESAGLGAKIKAVLLKSLMNTPFKFKAPAAVRVTMDEVYNYEDQAIEWINQRNELISFVVEVDDSLINKLLFKHGSGIRMNLVQMLEWTFAHADRHSRQIERITKHPKFPA